MKIYLRVLTSTLLCLLLFSLSYGQDIRPFKRGPKFTTENVERMYGIFYLKGLSQTHTIFGLRGPIGMISNFIYGTLIDKIDQNYIRQSANRCLQIKDGPMHFTQLRCASLAANEYDTILDNWDYSNACRVFAEVFRQIVNKMDLDGVTVDKTSLFGYFDDGSAWLHQGNKLTIRAPQGYYYDYYIDVGNEPELLLEY